MAADDSRIEVGAVFVDGSGQKYVVVDRKQARQTRGYWVQGNYKSDLDTVVKSYDNFFKDAMWVNAEGGSYFNRGVFATGYISLCKQEELDGFETENEFGPVSP